MLDYLWSGLILVSLVFGAINGRIFESSKQMLAAASRAVSLSVQLAAGYGFFCGMMELL